MHVRVLFTFSQHTFSYKSHWGKSFHGIRFSFLSDCQPPTASAVFLFRLWAWGWSWKKRLISSRAGVQVFEIKVVIGQKKKKERKTQTQTAGLPLMWTLGSYFTYIKKRIEWVIYFVSTWSFWINYFFVLMEAFQLILCQTSRWWSTQQLKGFNCECNSARIRSIIISRMAWIISVTLMFENLKRKEINIFFLKSNLSKGSRDSTVDEYKGWKKSIITILML